MVSSIIADIVVVTVTFLVTVWTVKGWSIIVAMPAAFLCPCLLSNVHIRFAAPITCTILMLLRSLDEVVSLAIILTIFWLVSYTPANLYIPAGVGIPLIHNLQPFSFALLISILIMWLVIKVTLESTDSRCSVMDTETVITAPDVSAGLGSSTNSERSEINYVNENDGKDDYVTEGETFSNGTVNEDACDKFIFEKILSTGKSQQSFGNVLFVEENNRIEEEVLLVERKSSQSYSETPLFEEGDRTEEDNKSCGETSLAEVSFCEEEHLIRKCNKILGEANEKHVECEASIVEERPQIYSESSLTSNENIACVGVESSLNKKESQPVVNAAHNQKGTSVENDSSEIFEMQLPQNQISDPLVKKSSRKEQYLAETGEEGHDNTLLIDYNIFGEATVAKDGYQFEPGIPIVEERQQIYSELSFIKAGNTACLGAESSLKKEESQSVINPVCSQIGSSVDNDASEIFETQLTQNQIFDPPIEEGERREDGHLVEKVDQDHEKEITELNNIIHPINKTMLVQNSTEKQLENVSLKNSKLPSNEKIDTVMFEEDKSHTLVSDESLTVDTTCNEDTSSSLVHDVCTIADENDSITIGDKYDAGTPTNVISSDKDIVSSQNKIHYTNINRDADDETFSVNNERLDSNTTRSGNAVIGTLSDVKPDEEHKTDRSSYEAQCGSNWVLVECTENEKELSHSNKKKTKSRGKKGSSHKSCKMQ